MQLKVILFLIYFGFVETKFFYNSYGKRLDNNTAEMLPWCGILRMKQNLASSDRKQSFLPWVGILHITQKGKTDAATGLILIAQRSALACANEVAKVTKNSIRTRSRAIFYSASNIPIIWNVTDYILHPEYGKTTINTFAIIILEKSNPKFKWQFISWPKLDTYIPKTKLFTVGYSDEKKVLEQRKYPMSHVNKITCKDFYSKEGMTLKVLWPSHVECYKRMGTNKTCVEDAGMALVRKDARKWTLIGMSTYGPSCILPARYIQFSPYVPWARSLLFTERRKPGFNSFRRQNDLRFDFPPGEEIGEEEEKALEEVDAIPIQKFDDRMQFHLNRIDDDTLALKVGPLNRTNEGCPPQAGYRPIYSEDGTFNVGYDDPGRVLYALSMYDMRVSGITCIVAHVNCSRHSDIVIDFAQQGFEQEDIGPLIQKIPLKSPIKEPPIPVRVIDITDRYYRYINITTTSLYFRFEFYGRADIQVELWGMLDKWETTTSTTTISPTSTTTRTYTHHMRPGPGGNTAWRFQGKRRRSWGQDRRFVWGQEVN